MFSGSELEEEIFHLREESGAAKFEDENEIRRVGVTEIGLT